MRERRREAAAAEQLVEQLACVLCGAQAAVALLIAPDDPDVPVVCGGFCAGCWENRERDDRAA